MNWQEIINDLERAGLTQVEIAQFAGCSQGHVSDLKTGRRGKRVDYGIGKRLDALHRERCQQAAS